MHALLRLYPTPSAMNLLTQFVHGPSRLGHENDQGRPKSFERIQ